MTEPAVPIGHAYICHAAADAGYAAKLAARLAAAGIPVTYDRPGEPDPTRERLRSRVAASAAVVVVMTPAAEGDERVNAQIDQAEEGGKAILPLLLSGRPFFRLGELPHWDVSGRMPSSDFFVRLGGAVGVNGVTDLAEPVRPWWRKGPIVTAGVLALVLVAAGAAVVLAGRGSTRATAGPSAGPTTAPSRVAALPAGIVRITEPADGAVVGRCTMVRGLANLDSGKTMIFAVNRTDPADATWYFQYVGSYPNGFVPAQWTGTVYLGSAANQSYDVFLLVMDVPSAKDFWTRYKSADGSFASASAMPQGTAPAAHIHVRQGTAADAC
jgi:hypothetical protein